MTARAASFLDHLILRVDDAARSVKFYRDVLGFEHEGRAEPFEIVRVNDGLTIDMMETPPADKIHLAFRLDRADFDAAHRQLVLRGIAFGNQPFARDGGPPAKSQGARGPADSLYFYDPDGHNLEIRTYDDAPGDARTGE